MTNTLSTVVDLQHALTELENASAQLESVPDWMQDLHERHSARLTEIEAFETAAEEATAVRRRAERASEDAEVRLKHFQDQIGMVRTQREYSALLQEIDGVKSEIKGLDDQALSAMEQIEEAQSQLEQQRADFASLDTEYTEALAKWEQEKPEVARRAEELERRVAELREGLPKGVQIAFDRTRERHKGQGTAQVRRVGGPAGDRLWHCSGCNYRVRLKVVSEIRRGVIAQCDSCKRILHVDESEV